MKKEASLDDADTIRTMIHRENEVINHRVTWLATMQGLFFAALGFAWDKSNIKLFVDLLCFLGIAMSVILFAPLAGATAAMYRLSEWWDNHKPQGYNGPDVIGLRPLKGPLFRYLGPWSLIPLLFLVAWVVVWQISG